ncbi:MAG TPA: substrate-binding domain-containing protein [Anaerolineales bacterium]|nr:substrate-binding domain-containing protein [Anaerolineales bacterium]
MNKPPLYQEIAESIRLEIIHGTLKAQDELPTVREMAEKWSCAPGTVLRAYQELAEQGLVVSRPGAGTHVTEALDNPPQSPLRTATLINSAESFLLKALSSGFAVDEIEPAFQSALERYRKIANKPEIDSATTIRFAGSHDPTIPMLVDTLKAAHPEYTVHVNFAGSLGGLIALARGEAELAGAHLWDQETDSYNAPYIRRLFPGKRIGLVNLVERRIGLITASGNPTNIKGLEDLSRSEIQFINRQHGAGTRVWLEAQLKNLGINTTSISGYKTEVLTHTEVAEAVRDGKAQAGLGIETAALAYGLEFIPLGTERYDLVIPKTHWNNPVIQSLIKLLSEKQTQNTISQMGGYELGLSGKVDWVA